MSPHQYHTHHTACPRCRRDFAYDPSQLLPEAASPQRPGSASGAAAGAGALGGEGSLVLPDLKPQVGGGGTGTCVLVAVG